MPAPDTVRYEQLGYMREFPPAPDKQVTRADYLVQYPKLRWAFQHMRELIPSRQVRRGAAAACVNRYHTGFPLTQSDLLHPRLVS